MDGRARAQEQGEELAKQQQAVAQLSSSPERMEVLRRTGGGGGGSGGRTARLALLSAGVALVLWWIATRALAPRGQAQLLSSRLVHVPAGGGSGGVGPRLEPWAHNRSCLVYILDASAELAPAAGVPQCNISDPEVRASTDLDVCICRQHVAHEHSVKLPLPPPGACRSGRMACRAGA